MLLSSGSGWTMLIIYVAIFAIIIYFFLVRPQSRQKKRVQDLQQNMAPGDSVLTTSGFYGVIIDILDNTVIVEFGNNRNCRIPMTKDAISVVEKPNGTRISENGK